MAKAKILGYPREDEIAKGVMKIHCPGCNQPHYINTKPYAPNIPVWGFNNDFDKPTFTPSLLVRSGKYVNPDFIEDPDFPNSSTICHSFIKDGKIQFLNDCTHNMKGQTVELPDI